MRISDSGRFNTPAVSPTSPSFAWSVLMTSQTSGPRRSAGRPPAGPSTKTMPACSSMRSPSSTYLSTRFDRGGADRSRCPQRVALCYSRHPWVKLSAGDSDPAHTGGAHTREIALPARAVSVEHVSTPPTAKQPEEPEADGSALRSEPGGDDDTAYEVHPIDPIADRFARHGWQGSRRTR